MTVLLQRLVQYAWIIYGLCVIGALIYLVQALSAHRDRSLAQFTLEHEMATSRLVRAWGMVLLLLLIGAIVFVVATFLLPEIPMLANSAIATPTAMIGVQPSTPAFTPTPSPMLAPPTATPTPTEIAVPTLQPTDTPEPTETPSAGATGELNVSFGNFAALVGYSLPSTQISNNAPVELTLYWQALEGQSPINYMVFTHLIAASGDSRLIAQDDDQPANGSRPTSQWSTGESIADVHPMTFVEPDYTGPARIEVGLYNPSNSGERVPTGEGADRVVLPVTVTITGP